MIVTRHGGHLPLRLGLIASYTSSSGNCFHTIISRVQMEQLRIMLVDDHPEVIRQVETCLSYEDDFDVCKVASLSNVADCLIECQPDILLIDPYLNSTFDFECIELAKGIIPSLIVIVLTAVVDTAAQVELRRVGADYILEKSIDSEEIKNTIRKAVAEKR